MIDFSGLANGKLNITYNTSELEKEGFELKFALDPENPVFKQVIDECLKQNVVYKTIDGEGCQKHIWIKNWKNI